MWAVPLAPPHDPTNHKQNKKIIHYCTRPAYGNKLKITKKREKKSSHQFSLTSKLNKKETKSENRARYESHMYTTDKFAYKKGSKHNITSV